MLNLVQLLKEMFAGSGSSIENYEFKNQRLHIKTKRNNTWYSSRGAIYGTDCVLLIFLLGICYLFTVPVWFFLIENVVIANVLFYACSIFFIWVGFKMVEVSCYAEMIVVIGINIIYILASLLICWQIMNFNENSVNNIPYLNILFKFHF